MKKFQILINCICPCYLRTVYSFTAYT